MAFHISVHQRSDTDLFDKPPEDVESQDFEQWESLCLERTLYDNPLGSGDTVYRYWSTPAVELGLPLIAAIYNSGLSVSDADLSRLESELIRLEQYWSTKAWEDEPPVRKSTIYEDGQSEEKEVPFGVHLRERSGYVRQAIESARVNDGIVTIS